MRLYPFLIYTYNLISNFAWKTQGLAEGLEGDRRVWSERWYWDLLWRALRLKICLNFQRLPTMGGWLRTEVTTHFRVPALRDLPHLSQVPQQSRRPGLNPRRDLNLLLGLSPRRDPHQHLSRVRP